MKPFSRFTTHGPVERRTWTGWHEGVRYEIRNVFPSEEAEGWECRVYVFAHDFKKVFGVDPPAPRRSVVYRAYVFFDDCIGYSDVISRGISYADAIKIMDPETGEINHLIYELGWHYCRGDDFHMTFDDVKKDVLETCARIADRIDG